MEAYDIKKIVLEDIDRCKSDISEYGHDAEKMAFLFSDIVFRYIDKIQGFTEELSVISPYDNTAAKAETYRNNVGILITRLEDFRDNGFSNENLRDFTLRNDFLFSQDLPSLNISEVRLQIGMMEGISQSEKTDILVKLDEMDEIFSLKQSKRKKWDALRPYVMWLSGKDIDIAMLIIPLFFKLK